MKNEYIKLLLFWLVLGTLLLAIGCLDPYQEKHFVTEKFILDDRIIGLFGTSSDNGQYLITRNKNENHYSCYYVNLGPGDIFTFNGSIYISDIGKGRKILNFYNTKSDYKNYARYEVNSNGSLSVSFLDKTFKNCVIKNNNLSSKSLEKSIRKNWDQRDVWVNTDGEKGSEIFFHENLSIAALNKIKASQARPNGSNVVKGILGGALILGILDILISDSDEIDNNTTCKCPQCLGGRVMFNPGVVTFDGGNNCPTCGGDGNTCR